MKHIQIFESFVSEAAEAAPFDPLKFKVAAELISKKIGQEQKTTLTFPEIKEVFGRDDYNLRFVLAQALMLAGKNYFPKNKYYPNPKKEGDLLFTHYIGEKDQNLMLQKVGKDALVVLKPLVALVEKDLAKPGLAETKFFKDSSPALPEVKKVKALLDKLPAGQFPM
jgi:hypothetical protein